MNDEVSLLLQLAEAYESMTGQDPEPWMGDNDREVCTVRMRDDEDD